MSKETLALALRAAEKAHAEYEKTLGTRDPNWPEWYAEFIVKHFGAGDQQCV